MPKKKPVNKRGQIVDNKKKPKSEIGELWVGTPINRNVGEQIYRRLGKMLDKGN